MSRVWLAAAISTLLFVASASAQQDAGFIHGNVADSGRSVLPGVTIHLSSFDTLVRDGMTDAGGNYVFDHLPAGMYTLTAELPGFVTVSRSIVLTAGEAVRVELVMAGAISDGDCPPLHWLQSISAGYALTQGSSGQSSFPLGVVVDFAGGGAFSGFAWVGEASVNHRAAENSDAGPGDIFSALGGARKSHRFVKSQLVVSGQLLAGLAFVNESSRVTPIASALAVQPGIAVEHDLMNHRVLLRSGFDIRFFALGSDGHSPGRNYRWTLSVVHEIPRWICL